MLEKKKFAWGYLLIALLFATLGVLFISIQEALDLLAVSIGVTLALFSVFFALLTLSKKDRGGKFFLRIIFSIMALIAGIVTAVFKAGAVLVILSISGLLLIIDGSFKLQTAIRLREGRSFMFWVMSALAIPTIILGFILIQFLPEVLEPWCSILLAIALLLDSASNFLTAFATHKLNRLLLRALSEEIEARAEEQAAAPATAEEASEASDGEPATTEDTESNTASECIENSSANEPETSAIEQETELTGAAASTPSEGDEAASIDFNDELDSYARGEDIDDEDEE